ncbi:carbonic anhydrase [Prolixibacteraceae bacterium Z1-6]|uniref:Carbonic anhydrase 2 n=1 Tax=Draconibacterium aestuarii TaxID=2998507 RepID=A0A9X3FHQ0_9BACT|nr:carbonic anhydrase [Prolixibacteraceae bacterium Z1-6]
MKSFDQIILANKHWAQEKKNIDPDYFKNLSLGQAPKYLWIGCSDSRIPEHEITNSEPGELFVHRNIANLVIDNDTNLMSVLKYAIDYLKVKHIVVCGHYYCGGVKAAYDDMNEEYIGSWISDVKHTHKASIDELNKLDNEEEKLHRLAELNVLHQINKLDTNAIIKHAREHGQRIFLHGWIFDIASGELKVLKEINPDD